MLGGFENKTAIVTMSKLAVDADCAQLVSENTAHDGDHAPRCGERREHVTRRPRVAPFEVVILTVSLSHPRPTPSRRVHDEASDKGL